MFTLDTVRTDPRQPVLDNRADTRSHYTRITVLAWLCHAPHGRTSGYGTRPRSCFACLFAPIPPHGRLRRSPWREKCRGSGRGLGKGRIRCSFSRIHFCCASSWNCIASSLQISRSFTFSSSFHIPAIRAASHLTIRAKSIQFGSISHSRLETVRDRAVPC